MIHVGFTGTRTGLTDPQTAALAKLLVSLAPLTLHHGDCVGADARAHEIALAASWPIVLHPPSAHFLRANCLGWTERREPLPYLERNEQIVRECSMLVACPEGPETQRSGTWSTVRFARKLGVEVRVVWSDGHVTVSVESS